jgi:hypothetical protein
VNDAVDAALVRRLVETLGAGDWDDRAEAAKALGRTGAADAVPPLVLALDAPSFAVQLAAVDALGDLGPVAAAALPALRSVAERHWLPFVRAAAAEAAGAIAAGHRRANGGRSTWSTLPRCPRAAPGVPAILPVTTWLEPSSSLEVKDGVLVGVDSGEFRGEVPSTGLHFRDTLGRSQQLIHHENVRAILRAGRELLAFTGLSHMGIDVGRVWKVTRDESGNWSARPWVDLLGEARQIGIDAEGALRVQTSFGAMRIAADGSITYLGCDQG